MENMIKENEIKLLTIKRLGINGEGIGYYKRLAVFIPGAIVGEEVEAKITKVEEKFAYGEIVNIKKASEFRVTPPCPYYGKCGGCQLQHMSYAEQLVQKRNIISEAFERYFEGDRSKFRIYDTIGMDEPFHYRNKTQLPTRHDGDKVVVGMYAMNSNRLVYIDECLIENPLVSKVVNEVCSLLTASEIDVFNPKFKQGNLRYLVVRAFEETNEAQVTFVLREKESRIIKILRKAIQVEHVSSVNYSINDDLKAIEIINQEVVHLEGKQKINGMLNNLKFEISADAFFQLNSKQSLVLYEQIKKSANLKGYEKVLDCYCGIGSIGMYLAKQAKEVRGIDTNKESILNANEFALMNKIENATFYAGNILPYFMQFAEEGFVPDVLVIDPPRRGIELNVLNYIKKHRIKKIIYVSCNPATLAKNLNHLHKAYSIKYVQPIDMFPNTSHVESCTLLEIR
ncbi:MAG: 23S rRNA (uracil(1939)-C(5))-methyltransferase RlmD [Bacilli bacterium]|jgi:23S rRNA (uracil-5-)-methyltransferase RumA|nr:23S rRNA (uracil(1939)-C(5))-methyltransferase RlmD [Bacilli bacterium]